jgi:TldD protein
LSIHSRREFVQRASSAIASGAATMILPGRAIARLDARQSIRAALGVGTERTFDPVELMAVALDVARRGGASYADCRIVRRRQQSARVDGTHGGHVSYGDNFTISVRVIVDGQWGFANIVVMTPDAVAAAARRAVKEGRTNAKWRSTPVELVAAPPVPDGHWASPMTIDPFEVPIGDQQEALLAGTESALAVHGVTSAKAATWFSRSDRLFASSEGSRITQVGFLAGPGAAVEASVGDESVAASAAPKGVGFTWGGYEVVLNAKLPDGMRAAAEEALRKSRALIGKAKPRSVEVGRYELVASPKMFWSLIAGTVLPALGMDRVIGRQEGAEGTSYASPPEAVLGQMRIGAPLLTVRGDRSLNGLAATGWDDEGVKPEAFTLIEKGVVVDYLALRETAPMLSEWYGKRGLPVRAHGVAVAGVLPVQESVPNSTVEPGPQNINVDDLIKDVKRGVYFSGPGDISPDFGLLNAYGEGLGAQEIRNGKVVGDLTDIAIQFQTQTFWKSLIAIGGSSSVESFVEGLRTVRSVPARFREVNVVNTGRTQ